MPNRSFYTEIDGRLVWPENIIYLNIARSPGSILNGVTYVLSPEQIALFDKREWIYDRVIVTSDLVDCVIEGGELVVYVGKRKHATPTIHSYFEAAIRQSYLDVIANGLRELGEEFKRAYELSTDAYPSRLVIADKKREGNPVLADSSS